MTRRTLIAVLIGMNLLLVSVVVLQALKSSGDEARRDR